MRNVSGDGDCVFLAVALATATSMGLGGSNTLLRAISRQTRDVVAQVLERGLIENEEEDSRASGTSSSVSDAKTGGNLWIEGKRLVTTRTLLKSAARGEGLSPRMQMPRISPWLNVGKDC